MRLLFDLLREHGGVASSFELGRVPRNVLDVAVMYGTVVRVKKGMWGLPDLDPLAVAAIRAGGRLACVSALEYHGVIEPVAGALHICASPGVVSWRPRSRRAGLVRHWSRRPLAGDRLAVAAEVAWAQFALCRVVSGREVRLRQPDSL